MVSAKPFHVREHTMRIKAALERNPHIWSTHISLSTGIISHATARFIYCRKRIPQNIDLFGGCECD
jgi:DNA-binding response OmpR family regulator